MLMLTLKVQARCYRCAHADEPTMEKWYRQRICGNCSNVEIDLHKRGVHWVCLPSIHPHPHPPPPPTHETFGWKTRDIFCVQSRNGSSWRNWKMWRQWKERKPSSSAMFLTLKPTSPGGEGKRYITLSTVTWPFIFMGEDVFCFCFLAAEIWNFFSWDVLDNTGGTVAPVKTTTTTTNTFSMFELTCNIV